MDELENQTGTEENPQEEEIGEGTTAELEEATDGNEEVESSESDSEGKSGFQKRIDELTAKRREEERQRIAAEERAEYWKSKAIPEKKKAPSVRPKVDDFEDYDDYIEALTDYKADIAVEKAVSKIEAKTAKQTVEQKLSNYHNAGISKFEDFQSTISRATITETMRDVLLDTDNGVEIGYHLGQNIAESQRIANLPDYMQAVELGKIAAKLETKPMKPGRTPVKPLKTVQGGQTNTIPDLNKPIPYDEWERYSSQG
jgi:hypothetical protein